MLQLKKQELNELVKKLRERDEQAQVLLYMTMHREMLALAKWYGLNEQDAYDAISNAFVNATTKIGQYQDNTNFRSWVLRIVRNEAVNLRRINEKHYLDEDFIIKCLTEESMEDEITTEQRDNALRREFDNLPEMQRKCCQLHYLERLTVKEVAETLGVSPNTVKTNVRLGFDKLKKILEQKGGRDAWYTTHGIAIAPLLASLLREDIASGLYEVPAEITTGILQAAGVAEAAATAAASTTAASTTTATATTATTGATTATATATAAPQAAVLAYTEVATTTAATTAATGTGLAAKFAALGVAAKAAIVTTAAVVTVGAVAVPVYVHNENEKAVMAMAVQEQEEQERQQAEEAERARQEAEAAEAERIAAEEEAAAEQATAEAEPEPQAGEQPTVETEASQPNGGESAQEQTPSQPEAKTYEELEAMTPMEWAEDGTAFNNPTVGQPEPAGGCPNPRVENPTWDSTIGGWRGTFGGRLILVRGDNGGINFAD